MDPLQKFASIDPAKRALTLLDEFKAFAFKGNVIDLAVGVIIGGAFAKITESLVKKIMMPLLSAILPADQPALHEWKFPVHGKEIPIGEFIGEVLNFLMVALVLFIFIVKFLGWMLKSKEEEAEKPLPPLTKDQELLSEIRDLLAKQKAG